MSAPTRCRGIRLAMVFGVAPEGEGAQRVYAKFEGVIIGAEWGSGILGRVSLMAVSSPGWTISQWVIWLINLASWVVG